MKEKTYILIFIHILLLSAVLRFSNLDLRPVHHDESSGYYLLVRGLIDNGVYKYDPVYHGPFLYHTQAAIYTLFGYSEFTMRLLPALLGLLMILLFIPLRKIIGYHASLAGALFITISPSMVYYSRFLLHDIYYVFFTFATITYFILYLRYSKNAYLYISVMSFAFMLTVKESFFISAFQFFCFGVLCIIFYNLKHISLVGVKENIIYNLKLLKKYFFENIKTLGWSLLIFSFITTLLFSSFYRYLSNIPLMFTASISHWVSTTNEWVGHQKPFIYFFQLLGLYEFFIVIFAIIGVGFVLNYLIKYVRGSNKGMNVHISDDLSRDSRDNHFNFMIGLFFAYYAITTLLIMSIIKYKTPWNVVSIVFAFVLLGAYGFENLYHSLKLKKVGYIALILLLFVSSIYFYKCLTLNYMDYDNDTKMIPYVQTERTIYDLIDSIKVYQGNIPNGMMKIAFLTDEIWPMYWYMRDYKVGWFGKNMDNPVDGYDIVVVNSIDKDKVDARLTSAGMEGRHFRVRGGIEYEVYFRKR